jgi:hypothetical protein
MGTRLGILSLLVLSMCVAGCLQKQWVIGFVAATDEPFILRIVLPSRTVDFLIEPHTSGTLIAQDEAELPATALLLDPDSCATLDAAELGAARMWIGVHQVPPTLLVSEKSNLAANDVLVEPDGRCSGAMTRRVAPRVTLSDAD